MAGLWKVCSFGEGDKDLKVAILIQRLELKVVEATLRHYGQGCSRSRYPWASNVELHYNQCTGASSDFCTQEWSSGGRSSRSPKEKEKAKRIGKGNEKGRDDGQRGKVGAKRTVKLLSQLWQDWSLGYWLLVAQEAAGRLATDCSSPKQQRGREVHEEVQSSPPARAVLRRLLPLGPRPCRTLPPREHQRMQRLPPPQPATTYLDHRGSATMKHSILFGGLRQPAFGVSHLSVCWAHACCMTASSHDFIMIASCAPWWTAAVNACTMSY